MSKPKQLAKEYYSLSKLDEIEAQYKIIFGQRSNGKTFAVQERILKNYVDKGEQGAIIRRYDLDFKSRRGYRTFEHFVKNPKRGNIVEEMTHGEWSDIFFYGGEWYLCNYDDKGNRIKDTNPFCFAFSLAGMEHDKSTSYPSVTTILFDEFITRQAYLPDEFVTFTNVLSTIIRDRNDVTIYLCGNTVNKYNNLYFTEMGLNHIREMKAGDLNVYRFAATKDKELRIAVEYADGMAEGKPSDVYFAFDNPKLQMITQGMWEISIYPHLPYKYTRKDVQLEFFILWENLTLHCEVVSIEVNRHNVAFIYVHMKTTPIRDEDDAIIFSTDFDARYNHRRRINHIYDEAQKRLYGFFIRDKVFYQDNEVGEIMRNYLQWCEQGKDFV